MSYHRSLEYSLGCLPIYGFFPPNVLLVGKTGEIGRWAGVADS